jgi:hypothetical protein
VRTPVDPVSSPRPGYMRAVYRILACLRTPQHPAGLAPR